MRRRTQRLRFLLLTAVTVCAALVGVVAEADGVLRSLELNTVDARFAIRGRRPPPKDIVLVVLDQRSLRTLSLQPPLPRSLHARLIRRLSQANPRLIADDFQFVGRTTSGEDRALIRAIAKSSPVLLGTHDVGAGPLAIAGRVANPRRLGARFGSVAVLNDSDGKIRRMLYIPVDIKSFDVAAAELVRGHPVSEHSFPDNAAWIDYRGAPGTFRTYSFVDVLAGRVPAAAFTGKTVIIGASDPIEKDVFLTPTSDREMAGTEIHANSIATILAGFPLRPVEGSVNYALVIAFALLTLPIYRRSSLVMLAVSAGALAALAGGAQVSFDSGRIIMVTYPALALVLATMGAVAVDFFGERRDRRHMRQVFSRFVPAAVVDDVIDRTGEDLRLGGVRHEGTVMFADLRGFTAFSETVDPELVVDVVNRYLSEMSEAIFGCGGTLVSYLGDGIMALFGAPIAQADHADRALAAAREMLGDRLADFNSWLRERGLDHRFQIGIGLNSGVVMSGNVGSEYRLEFTAIGDTPNIAARLESMTKDSGHQLYVAEATRSCLVNMPDDLIKVGDLPIRGRQAKVRVWGLDAVESTAGL